MVRKDKITAITVTKQNLNEVSQRLEKEKGAILVAKPGPGSFSDSIEDVSSYLFFHPEIEGGRLNTGANEGNRDYLLRPIPPPTGNNTGDLAWNLARSLPQRLNLSNQYEFRIGGQPPISMGALTRSGVTIYIPPEFSVGEAFFSALKHFVDPINKALEEESVPFCLTEEHLTLIVNYTINDLETGEVLRHNTQAGIKADSITGF
ncbi:MAG TPA: hypothetical protein P5274_02430 [Candidatus Paceibacterota bacterium]|nr:hypothetical protein [Candidatus Paceibacterota bacterium]